MPFTKQYFHLRDLQRTGRAPQFGSFKYSAAYLYEKGILLSIDQFSPRQFDKINLILSSDKAGHFEVELSNTTLGHAMPIASTEIRMEDLLQAQFENRVSFPLFDGMAKFNLNLLLYQINKKCVVFISPLISEAHHFFTLQVLRLIYLHLSLFVDCHCCFRFDIAIVTSDVYFVLFSLFTKITHLYEYKHSPCIYTLE